MVVTIPILKFLRNVRLSHRRMFFFSECIMTFSTIAPYYLQILLLAYLFTDEFLFRAELWRRWGAD